MKTYPTGKTSKAREPEETGACRKLMRFIGEYKVSTAKEDGGDDGESDST
jgi:hypothetical protein